MSAPKNVARFHYQHPIYLPRPQSLAIVLGVFKLNYQAKLEKGGNGKGRKKKKANGLPSHLSLRTLKKPAHEAVQLIPRHAMLFILFSSNALSIGYTCSLPLYVKGRLCSESKLKSCYYYTMVTILYI